MTVQEKVYTIADLMELDRQPETRPIPTLYELSRGRLITMSPAGALHGMYGNLFAHFITLFVLPRKLGYVTAAETGCILDLPGSKDTVRAPDVGFIRKERLPNGMPDKGYIPAPPDLAVEIVSPNDPADEIEAKIQDYLEGGTPLIWYFYPKTRTLQVITPSGTSRLGENDTLDGGDVLPGFSLALKPLFESD
jgi:Uma2 family endonuclease